MLCNLRVLNSKLALHSRSHFYDDNIHNYNIDIDSLLFVDLFVLSVNVVTVCSDCIVVCTSAEQPGSAWFQCHFDRFSK